MSASQLEAETHQAETHQKRANQLEAETHQKRANMLIAYSRAAAGAPGLPTAPPAHVLHKQLSTLHVASAGMSAQVGTGAAEQVAVEGGAPSAAANDDAANSGSATQHGAGSERAHTAADAAANPEGPPKPQGLPSDEQWVPQEELDEAMTFPARTSASGARRPAVPEEAVTEEGERAAAAEAVIGMAQVPETAVVSTGVKRPGAPEDTPLSKIPRGPD